MEGKGANICRLLSQISYIGERTILKNTNVNYILRISHTTTMASQPNLPNPNESSYMGVTSPLFLQAPRINFPPAAAATSSPASSPAADATSLPNFSGIDASGHAKTIELETVSCTIVIIDVVHLFAHVFYPFLQV